MCGIAGIIGRIGPKNRAALERMQSAMSHRGPDGEGIWEAEPDENGYGPMLAHRRLSILDLSAAGAQPMRDPITGDVIVLNGEIYNFAELRRSLGADAQNLESSGDTAVLLRMLASRGSETLTKLRGMFAFAYYDRSARTLTLARDPFGIKPLYVAYNRNSSDQSWSVMFASELQALLASGLLNDVRLNPDAVASVVWSGFLVSPVTTVVGVESVMSGQYLEFDNSGRVRRTVEYWSATATEEPRLHEEDVAAAVRECVRMHLVSDVPVGIFLSGGVDSSAVANLAQKASGQRIHTYTLVLREAELNEGAYARRIANAIGTEHHEVLLTERFFLDLLDTALDSLDQPSFDGLNSFFISQAVRQAGLKVALVGSGGDELFGGYTTFRDLPRIFEWTGRARRYFPNLRANMLRTVLALHQRGGSFPPQTRWAKLPEMMTQSENLVALYQLAYALFLPESQALLLGEVALHSNLVDGLPEMMRGRLGNEIAGRSPLSAISTMEQRLFLGERCLRDIDATSMAASIEVRVPFVDHVLHDVVNRLSDADRYEPVRTKSLLRRVGLAGLDPNLFDRPKSGFELPIERWLRSDVGRQVDATLRDHALVAPIGLNPQAVAQLWNAYLEGAPGLYWTRIWALYVLIRWCHRHRVFL